MAADTGPGKAELGNGSAYLGSLGTPAPEVLQSATLCFLRHGDCPRHREGGSTSAAEPWWRSCRSRAIGRLCEVQGAVDARVPFQALR